MQVSPRLIPFGMVMLRCVHPHEIGKKEPMLLRISSVLQREPRMLSKEGKMEKSFLNFKAHISIYELQHPI